MADRHFPVRPNLEQLKHQAKDLLRDVRAGTPEAIAEFQKFHPHPDRAERAKLADAQFVLARSYGLPSWIRLVLACQVTQAIRDDQIDAVRRLIAKHPYLLHEDARGIKSNWGPPMSYAANLGRDAIVRMLYDMGAKDVQHAFDRACLQGKLDTARQLHTMGGVPAAGLVMGPCETLSAAGLRLALELGSPFSDKHGDRLAPVAMLLENYARYPEGKHACLQIAAEQGITLPDTPPMAIHRGRIDLLEKHLARDPDLLSRTFGHEEIYPPSLSCHKDHSLALHGAPLDGATLLHLCIDFDEMEIAEWLLSRGADVNAKAALDADGFGGHTALFGCVVSQPYRCGRQKDASATRLLLDHGADPKIRASLRKRLRFVADEATHEYHDVTPLEFGEQFHDQDWMNRPAMQMIVEHVR